MPDNALVLVFDHVRSNIDQNFEIYKFYTQVVGMSDFPEGEHFQNFEESASHHWKGFQTLSKQEGVAEITLTIYFDVLLGGYYPGHA